MPGGSVGCRSSRPEVRLVWVRARGSRRLRRRRASVDNGWRPGDGPGKPPGAPLAAPRRGGAQRRWWRWASVATSSCRGRQASSRTQPTCRHARSSPASSCDDGQLGWAGGHDRVALLHPTASPAGVTVREKEKPQEPLWSPTRRAGSRVPYGELLARATAAATWEPRPVNGGDDFHLNQIVAARDGTL